MLETIFGVAAVVGWPKLLLAGLVVVINLVPRGMSWRAGSAALAVAVASILIFLDWSEKRRVYGENWELRQTARNAVIEQRAQKIEATKTRHVIDGMARELISEDLMALTLHDVAVAYDNTLADEYIEKFLELQTTNNPAIAAMWSLGVFIDRVNAEIPEMGDNVLYFLTKDYVPLFRKLKSVDPQACASFMQRGRTPMSADALSEAFSAAGIAFRTMPDKTRPISKGTSSEALAFGERVLGRERLARLISFEQPFADTCEDLATIYDAIYQESTPAAFAASRYWLQPSRFLEH